MIGMSSTTDDDITLRVLDRCTAMGFALAGACDAQPTEFADELREWLAANKHGEMGYLTRSIELRLNPAKFVPGAKSIVCVADRYVGETPKRRNAETPKQAVGVIARYARGKDYHRIMRDRLGKLSRDLARDFPGNRFRACVDTAPVLEREYAQRAGLGAIGKNTMLIRRGEGSWLLLGEIITTLPLASSRCADPDPCGACTRCIDACPTKAIAQQGWQIDATRCISYLTIEHGSLIDEQYYEAMGDWLFGCDICQEVCPHNSATTDSGRRKMAATPVHPAYAPRHESFDLLEVLGWDDEARRQALVNSAMKRARLDMLKRNAVIIAGNALRAGKGSAALRQALRRIEQSTAEPAIVRETARLVMDRF